MLEINLTEAIELVLYNHGLVRSSEGGWHLVVKDGLVDNLVAAVVSVIQEKDEADSV